MEKLHHRTETLYWAKATKTIISLDSLCLFRISRCFVTVGIGNEKGDLTRFGVEHGKNSRVSSAPTSKALSSLGPSDIIQSLTRGYRLSKTKSTELFREAVWPRIQARDSEYYQKLREFEYKKIARNKLNQVVLQKHQKNLANDVNRETDEAVIKTQQAEETNAEEIKVKQVEAAKVKEMQETKAFVSSYGNQLASTSSAPNDDEVVILTKAKYERLLQSAEKVDKLEEKLLQILNLLQQRNIVISDG
ncbi:unnamed protein product [Trifolium pratense]|uniref:Uncharacterized protein n=1 Tax=Trifolium pratense TaxID=57577 RepID=A0ACB0II73_TRIPR|nr:unnamed protein product [Trifolium pratense]